MEKTSNCFCAWGFCVVVFDHHTQFYISRKQTWCILFWVFKNGKIHNQLHTLINSISSKMTLQPSITYRGGYYYLTERVVVGWGTIIYFLTQKLICKYISGPRSFRTFFRVIIVKYLLTIYYFGDLKSNQDEYSVFIIIGTEIQDLGFKTMIYSVLNEWSNTELLVVLLLVVVQGRIFSLLTPRNYEYFSTLEKFVPEKGYMQ